MGFQSAAGPVVHSALQRTVSDAEALGRLDSLYRESLKHADGIS
jgi:hypothetical protein